MANPDENLERMAAEAIPARSFRWRTIPVALIGGFGAIGVAMGVASMLYMVITSITGEPLYDPGPPAGFDQLGLTIALVVIAMGGWLVLTAHQLWKWHWKTALAMLAACIAANQLAIYFELLPE